MLKTFQQNSRMRASLFMRSFDPFQDKIRLHDLTDRKHEIYQRTGEAVRVRQS